MWKKWLDYEGKVNNFKIYDVTALTKIVMHICTIYLEADCDVTSFMFPISSFFNMTKNSIQKLKYLENEKSY